MKTPPLHIDPSFTLNGLSFETDADVLDFAHSLKRDGAPHERSMGKFIMKWLNDDAHISVKTSGSTGKPKKILLSKQAMINSAKATGAYFKVGEKTTALLCLHPKFIAGKMMLVRAMTLGWHLHVVAPEKDALTQYDNDYDFAAMVPYQVRHSIDALGKVKKLIIGGGPISMKLDEMLQDVPTEAFATYGMTETITHIAVRRINGPAKSQHYHGLPDVKFDIDDRGCLKINAPRIHPETIVTNDLVNLTTSSSFEWLGRVDNVINSGGIKIYPEKVEQKLADVIDFPFIITSQPDEALGERVILVIENKHEVSIPNYSEAFETLQPYEKPKKIYTVSKFPYTENGKIKRNEVLSVLKKY
ncbi:AMP-binding protein [Jejudonia soesokkakensis]|uniref:AMP-binding protein n=1 Tax=Jejudonia soesokkakensis TaxID=1323432 RepID=A0ABW2MW00_9FLAO